MASLDFDEALHQYRIDGVPVPSVTQLVAPLGADIDDLDDNMELTVEAAADRGVTMHAYLAHRLNGGTPGEFELPDIYQDYANGVELFLAEHRIEPFLIEIPMAGDGYAGTPDLVGNFDSVLSILDYKFVSQISKSKVGAQLAGYQAACWKNDIFPDALYAVQFLPDSSYRLYPIEEVPAMEAFSVCRMLYAYKTKKHPRGRIG